MILFLKKRVALTRIMNYDTNPKWYEVRPLIIYCKTPLLTSLFFDGDVIANFIIQITKTHFLPLSHEKILLDSPFFRSYDTFLDFRFFFLKENIS